MTDKYTEANEFAEKCPLDPGTTNFIAEVCIIGADRHWGFDLCQQGYICPKGIILGTPDD